MLKHSLCNDIEHRDRQDSKLPPCFSWETDDDTVSEVRRSRLNSMQSSSTAGGLGSRGNINNKSSVRGSSVRYSERFRPSSILMMGSVRNSVMSVNSTSTGNPINSDHDMAAAAPAGNHNGNIAV